MQTNFPSLFWGPKVADPLPPFSWGRGEGKGQISPCMTRSLQITALRITKQCYLMIQYYSCTIVFRARTPFSPTLTCQRALPVHMRHARTCTYIQWIDHGSMDCLTLYSGFPKSCNCKSQSHDQYEQSDQPVGSNHFRFPLSC